MNKFFVDLSAGYFNSIEPYSKAETQIMAFSSRVLL